MGGICIYNHPREASAWQRNSDLSKHPRVPSRAWEQGACEEREWVHFSIDESEWVNGPRGLLMVW